MTKNRPTSVVYVQVIAKTLLKSLLRCLVTPCGRVITPNNRRNTPVTGTRKARPPRNDADKFESAPDFDPSEELDPTRPVRV